MVSIYCRTNLDISSLEQWPEGLPCCPRVGDQIDSGKTWAGGVHLSLEVVKVNFKYNGAGVWRIEIELHLPKSWQLTIEQFEVWYKGIVD